MARHEDWLTRERAFIADRIDSWNRSATSMMISATTAARSANKFRTAATEFVIEAMDERTAMMSLEERVVEVIESMVDLRKRPSRAIMSARLRASCVDRRA